MVQKSKWVSRDQRRELAVHREQEKRRWRDSSVHRGHAALVCPYF